MNFSEKLMKLRKENKLSQEQLANMLDVSRQSVSKWESGQTYPEMDKLLALCKIFKCTLDELTNDEISKEEITNSSKKKNTFRSAIYEMLGFINKSISMLKAMSFKQIIKMLFELLTLTIFLLILYLPFMLVINVGSNAIRYIFGYRYSLVYLWSGTINLIYWLLFIMIFVYIYKVRFVDKYEEVDSFEVKLAKDNKKDEVIARQIIINTEKKDNKNFALFNILSTIVKWTIKLIALFIGVPLIFTLIFLVFSFIINIILIFKGVMFFGIFFGLIFLALFNTMILEMIFKFIFNMGINFKKMFVMFLSSIIGFGASLGIFVFEISNIKYIDEIPKDFELTTKEYEFTMKDNLFIDTYNSVVVKLINRPDNRCYYDGDYYLCTDFRMEVVQDDTLTDQIKIELQYVKDFDNMYINEYDNSIFIGRDSLFDFNSFIRLNNIIIKNLKDKKVYNYNDTTMASVKITLSSKTKELLEKNAAEHLKIREEQYQNERIKELELEISSLELEKSNLENTILSEQEKNQDLNDKIDELNSKIEELNNKINEYKKRISSLLDE